MERNSILNRLRRLHAQDLKVGLPVYTDRGFPGAIVKVHEDGRISVRVTGFSKLLVCDVDSVHSADNADWETTQDTRSPHPGDAKPRRSGSMKRGWIDPMRRKKPKRKKNERLGDPDE